MTGSADTASPPQQQRLQQHSEHQHPQRHERAQRNPEQARVGGAQPAGAGTNQVIQASTTPSATGGGDATPSRRERVEPTPQARGNQQALRH